MLDAAITTTFSYENFIKAFHLITLVYFLWVFTVDIFLTTDFHTSDCLFCLFGDTWRPSHSRDKVYIIYSKSAFFFFIFSFQKKTENLARSAEREKISQNPPSPYSFPFYWYQRFEYLFGNIFPFPLFRYLFRNNWI